MFKPSTYAARRKKLKSKFDTGLLIFLGNRESPMNYPDNCYHDVQDSSFIYYWGHQDSGLAGLIDLDDDRETLFGHDLTVDEIVWMGAQATLQDKAAQVGAADTAEFDTLAETIRSAREQGKRIHFLPQYRSNNAIFLAECLAVSPSMLNDLASLELGKAIIGQRSCKSKEELREIETALEITYDMHLYAMKHTRAGITERNIAGAIEGIALAGGNGTAYPVIFTVHGETLHNHYHGNIMQAGQLAINDSGASAISGYAGDITRTIPVSGNFTDQQKEIYEIVLTALDTSINMVAPDVKFKDVHLHASRVIADGLKSVGLMKGDMEEAVAAGAHALFFPHGLGHMMGLDVHDMEGLGEDRVGYDDEVQRSDQFGLAYLRFGKRPQPGYVLTVEPGIYFIPELIAGWKAEKKHKRFINYSKVEKYLGFGGLRIEDNIVVTEEGSRILGKPIPKTIADVEAQSG